jgi:hypothetical protein
MAIWPFTIVATPESLKWHHFLPEPLLYSPSAQLLLLLLLYYIICYYGLLATYLCHKYPLVVNLTTLSDYMASSGISNNNATTSSTNTVTNKADVTTYKPASFP